MKIRLLTREELDQSINLVWKVFCEYEAVNYKDIAELRELIEERQEI